MELRDLSLPEENTERDILNGGEESPTEIAENATVEAMDADEKQSNEPNDKKHLTKEEIIATLKDLNLKDGSEISRDEITHLKQAFFAIRKNELAVEKQAFLEKGNEEAAFAPMPDEAEEQFQAIMKELKEKKAAYIAEVEAQKQANLAKKLEIIDELEKLAEDTDNVNRTFPRFRELTQEFKNAGEVPPTETTDIYRNYSAAVERFYDRLKINKDLRDYDFKKNLEQKQLLIDEAEKLAAENDVILAFRRLQELHEKWRETGPVAKEIRESIWEKFKDASAVINKRYQDFFEQRKARERENEEKKTEICERVEALDFSSLKNYAAWEEMTKTILAAQQDWKKLGFASKKVNNTLFARFRETCDKFFAAKAEFFKNIRENHSANLDKKVALCEKAEALKESTDWKNTADKLVSLQKEWKTIGSVDKKHSDAVWERFQQACDYFFDRRKKATSSTRKAEQQNLKDKNSVIESLKNIPLETPRDEAVKLIKDAMAKWQQIGHVPFKDKDKVYNAYREIVDKLYDHFDVKETRANMANFANDINEMAADTNKLYRERERLARACEQKRSELKTYENNLGFFNITSKGGNSLLKDNERRMQRIKEDIAALESKIKLIDSKL
ncbi:DUF349 domain-containing protein [uncultured Muribaculum sp.]|uniref:DUF349 domain-containing protein n=1 Tax=uncultured Muribaculum sp. TaxID=1918613 RepID=UPI00259878B7|nr:DUF349 domain-containing protein [uncultured Muribaculum sp.]